MRLFQVPLSLHFGPFDSLIHFLFLVVFDLSLGLECPPDETEQKLRLLILLLPPLPSPPPPPPPPSVCVTFPIMRSHSH